MIAHKLMQLHIDDRLSEIVIRPLSRKKLNFRIRMKIQRDLFIAKLKNIQCKLDTIREIVQHPDWLPKRTGRTIEKLTFARLKYEQKLSCILVELAEMY